MIRKATSQDIRKIVELGVEFITTRPQNGHPVRAESLARTAERYIGLEDGEVFVYDTPDGIVGVIGVGLFPHPFSGEVTAYELFWWVDPRSKASGIRSVRLLKAAEEWAQSRGATLMQVAAPDGSKVGRLYERLGFGRTETMYQRRI